MTFLTHALADANIDRDSAERIACALMPAHRRKADSAHCRGNHRVGPVRASGALIGSVCSCYREGRH
jgi:hypothetical protein